jgi:hypothetical protein
MKRLRIPAIVDLIRVSDPELIADLADDPRLDRQYVSRGPLLNRIVTGRVRKVMSLDGSPMPSAAPRGAQRPVPAQAALEARLNPIAAALDASDPSVQALARYVRGEGPVDAAGPLAQDAVGRLFAPDFKSDAASWTAAEVFGQAPQTFNPFLLVWWALTGAVDKARRLLANKVGHDPSGVHGIGIAIHNFVSAFSRMRALWADASARARLTPEAAAAQCLFAPVQVVRQPTRAGASLAGEFGDATLILLRLRDANDRSPSPEMAFMTQSWARCPAHAWVPALLAAVWRAAQG